VLGHQRTRCVENPVSVAFGVSTQGSGGGHGVP
jgi:hypothetical protein